MNCPFALRAFSSGLRCAVGCWFIAVFQGAAGDWPQYRGPNHDGSSPDRINTQWSGSVTNPVWLVPVTNSLSSFAVSAGRAFTQVRRNIAGADKEVCVALSITNGAELWSTKVDDNATYSGGVGYDDGPRTTPATEGGSVYVLSSYLNLWRLNASDGSAVWSTNLVDGYGATVIGWQNAASPLLDNGLLFLNANCGTSTILALRTSDASPAWRSQDEALTHSTPVLATIHGVRQLIFATQSGLVSLDPSSGSLLWKFPYPFSFAVSLAVSPVVWNDLVFVCGANAYGMGSVVMQATVTNSLWTATQLWFTSNPASHWMTPVAFQGFLYGQFGVGGFDSPSAQLDCIDMRTGAMKWSAGGFGRGGTLLVDNLLLALTETGCLVLAQPNTNAYTELGRFLAIPNYYPDTNKCCNSPAVADGRVYVRSTSSGACYDLSVPDLKLDPPQPLAANKFQLTVRTSNGTAMNSNRVATLEVRASTNLALLPSVWPKLTNNLVLTNGVVLVTNLDGTVSSRRFFITSEPK